MDFRVHGYGLMGAAARSPQSGTCMDTAHTEELTRLDQILEELSSPAEAQCKSLREHLESARMSLLGSMPTEYALNLEMAGQALNCISDHSLRARIQNFVHSARAKDEGRPDAREEDR
jgi:hypothetical protein